MSRIRHRPRTRRRPAPRSISRATAAICAVLITTGCTTAHGEPTAAGTVTVTSTVPAVPPLSVPSTTRSTPAPPPAAHPATATTGGAPSTTRRTAATQHTSTRHPRTSTGRTLPTPPGSLSTGDLIAAAASAAAAAGVAPANPDTPGPPTGPPCTADRNYVNEAPTGLRSDVVSAWRAAVRAAAEKGVTLCLNDGKRSRAQQQEQFDQYVQQYGRTVAEELVLPPNKSAHVVGIAVDVQPAAGYRWLQATDGSLGFCRIYDNEPWHFEFNPAYRTDGCPARLPEPER